MKTYILTYGCSENMNTWEELYELTSDESIEKIEKDLWDSVFENHIGDHLPDEDHEDFEDILTVECEKYYHEVVEKVEEK